MNVEIGAEAVLFPEKDYICGIFVAVRDKYIRLCLLQFNYVIGKTGLLLQPGWIYIPLILFQLNYVTGKKQSILQPG